ncbi:MAG TPA: serine/threonine-protein kinase [Candidatus Saccharimonadales bacterium]|nr:serine/threonine-protein kinase [Candidatus Saccharimonadales bacterium]
MDRTGQQIGNYRLIHLLGSGGFADVYIAEHIYIKKQTAIKILKGPLSSADQNSFILEAQIVENLKHPNIIPLIDFGLDSNGSPYLIMEYIPKGTLRNIYPKGTKVPLSKVAIYVQQLAEALQYAHDHKFIHRDLKPENVLLDFKDQVFLSDFGISTIRHNTMSLPQHPTAYSGTPAYSALEQINGQPRPESDQYSLAIIAYELLTGEQPFKGNPVSILFQQATAIPRKPTHINPNIPTSVETAILKALQKDYRQRYRAIKDFAEALCQTPQKYGDTTVVRYYYPRLMKTLEKGEVVENIRWSKDNKFLNIVFTSSPSITIAVITGEIVRTTTFEANKFKQELRSG